MRPLLKESHPELREEWFSERNSDVDFNQLRENSGILVWWRCSKNSKHEWQAHVRRRSLEGNGCPFCSGQRVLKENSLASLHPNIGAEWHPTLNGRSAPWQLSPISPKRVWWQCSSPLKHVWRSTVKARTRDGAGCKECNALGKSLLNAAPQLAKQWHPTKNGELTPASIPVNARQTVWWLCPDNPDHEWEAGIDFRVRANTSCPICARASHNRGKQTIPQSAPWLVKEWHPTKNAGVTPDDVSRGSNFKAWWICPKGANHVWKTAVHARATRKTGCPFCSRRSSRLLPGRSLSDRFPRIAREWHPAKNGSLTPDLVLPGSDKRVWWQCQVNPDHTWINFVKCRTNPRSKGLCPFCRSVQAINENSLLKCHPDVATEWHPTKNAPLTPGNVTRAGRRVVWWQCKKNSSHEWQTSTKHRTLLGSGCPHCYADIRGTLMQNALLESAGANIDYFGTFCAEMVSLRSLTRLAVPDRNKQKQTMLRMLYSSGITALETYLSDAFYHNVISNDSLVEKLLNSAPELKEKKYSLVEVIDWSRNLKQKVSEYLYDIIWHNLPKVRMMYETILGVSFPKDAAAVHRAVVTRHDLVHRSGRTKDRVLLKLKTEEVNTLYDNIDLFVDCINNQLQQKRAQPAAMLVNGTR